FRQDLLPYNINDYLNFLAQDPRALLLSSSLREKFNLKEGDSVFVTWGDQGYLEGIVYAFVDYWPTYNPNSKQANATSDVKTTDVKASVIETPDIIIANYSYIRAKMALEPYEVWIGKATDATSQTIYDGIEDKDINITALQDTDQMIINMKNDPMVQGTNGVLTLGFIVTMAISTIGFLIYWILSIQRRVLNFGIFRAMGLSSGKVIGMLIWEQVLISGVAVIMGILIGGLSSELFVPLLQLGQSASVPPFHVVTNRSDYIRVYTLVSMMLALGILILGIIVSRIKIAQAIKLGED
ncbi:MAG: ABC transporter permease, partial [Firmicutes bacterium]|nr:ABC transporter permease [Bacillota bacterium]